MAPEDVEQMAEESAAEVAAGYALGRSGEAAAGGAVEGIIERNQENIERLGHDLTPMGSPVAGNGDEIPAWTGG